MMRSKKPHKIIVSPFFSKKMISLSLQCHLDNSIPLWKWPMFTHTKNLWMGTGEARREGSKLWAWIVTATKHWHFLPMDSNLWEKKNDLNFDASNDIFSIFWGWNTNWRDLVACNKVRGFDTTCQFGFDDNCFCFSPGQPEPPQCLPFCNQKRYSQFFKLLEFDVVTGRGIENCPFHIVSQTISCQIISQKEGHFCNREQDVRGKTELIWRRKS